MTPWPASRADWVVYVLGVLTVVVAVLVFVALCSGCSGAQHPPERPQPWDVARSAVELARDAVEGLRPLIPAEALEEERAERCGEAPPSECADALTLTTQALDVAVAGIDTWEAAETAPSQWAAWTTAILRGLAVAADLVKSAGVAIPGYVGAALTGAGVLIQMIAGLIGGGS